MRHAGFVLVGGRSSRMGRDKALIPWAGQTLAQRAASVLAEVTHPVILIGSPKRYHQLGYAVQPDLFDQCGPAGGIATALRISTTDWNLVAACDMPGLTAAALQMLLDKCDSTAMDCIVAAGETGLEPLCAVYHRRCLRVFERSLEEGRFRMREIVAGLRLETVAQIDPAVFRNLNTPGDLQEFLR